MDDDAAVDDGTSGINGADEEFDSDRQVDATADVDESDCGQTGGTDAVVSPVPGVQANGSIVYMVATTILSSKKIVSILSKYFAFN